MYPVDDELPEIELMTERVYNFSAGPAVLPEPVLAEAQRDLMALPGVGSSVLEISHRSKVFRTILEEAESNLRELLQIPETYRVLFLQGGSRWQFSMIPLNLLRGSRRSADYILTGSWGQQASEEARREGPVHVAWDGSQTRFDRLPPPGSLDLDVNAAYVHFTSNETIEGVQFVEEPQVGEVSLVCDASSDFLSRPLSVDRYGLIYACAQKNTGPAGVTVVIIRDDLIEVGGTNLGSMLQYRVHAGKSSLYNTAPTFSIYIVKLVTRWLLNDIGGLEKMSQQNRLKAAWLYEAIDRSDGFYVGHAQVDSRSYMNVTFCLRDKALEKEFLVTAERHGLTSLGGHRSVGGIRASIYNAMPLVGVKKLRAFMDDFRLNQAK